MATRRGSKSTNSEEDKTKSAEGSKSTSVDANDESEAAVDSNTEKLATETGETKKSTGRNSKADTTAKAAESDGTGSKNDEDDSTSLEDTASPDKDAESGAKFDPYNDDDLHDPATLESDEALRQAVLEQNDAEHGDEHGHRSLAATALMVLVGVLFIGSLTLWAAPKLAPHLPAGIAKYLTPGQVDTNARLAALEQRIAADAEKASAQISTLEAQVAALSRQIENSASMDAANAAIAAAEAAAQDAATLAAHLANVDQEVVGLRGELGAISSALDEAAAGTGATPAEVSAKLAAVGARLDAIAAAIEDGSAAKSLEGQLAALATRLDAVESSAADARDVQDQALGAVSNAIEEARLQAALDLLASRLTGGLSYGVKLNEIAGMTGKAPPEALSKSAANGVATAAALKASFSRHAHEAVAADVQASSSDGGGFYALGWLRSKVAGRPVDERTGDDVGAVTSRIGARVDEGDLSAALAEAEALPEHAQQGLGTWLTQLRNRVDAENALDGWRAELTAGG